MRVWHAFRIESGDDEGLRRLDRVAKDNNVVFNPRLGWVTDSMRKAGIFAFALVGLGFKFEYQRKEDDSE